MKKTIVIVVSIFIFVAILFFLDLPAYNQFTSFREEIKSNKEFLQEKEELVAKVSQLKQVYESRKNEFDKVYYTLPLGEDIPNLIVQLEALAAENGLLLKSITFVKKPKAVFVPAEEEGVQGQAAVSAEKNYKTVSIALSTIGSYQAFSSFLEALELNVRLMDIKSIGFLSPEKGTEGSSIFTFSISLETYYQ